MGEVKKTPNSKWKVRGRGQEHFVDLLTWAEKDDALSAMMEVRRVFLEMIFSLESTKTGQQHVR